MGNLINLAVYNPAILNDEDFLDGFVARRDQMERLLNRLGEITPKNVARHLLLIGQRGMGKTSMLRRLALGVMNDPALSAVLLPLTFREEQYNVHNLHVFWCNCLDALADYLEINDQRDRALQLDREIGDLSSRGIDPDGTAACALFKEWCAREGKRPLLLVDNIDLIFSGLKEQHQWGLRRILQERGGVVIVGASAGFLETAARVEAPFYDFFQVHQLEKLTHPELLSCLRQIALKRGEPGKRVLKVLDSDPARIHTLYDLTGGNPRTLVLLYLLMELDSEGDVMDDLERLLDQVTALYKARVEDLAPQTRVVLDAVALAWNPVTVAQIAAETGIETTSVSSQFDRLMKMGVLEKVSLSKPAPTGYQLGERFFNIWYLMRNASRRMRNRLRWLTEFLRRLYTPQQLSTLADDFIKRSKERSRCSGVYGLALADALEDTTLRHSMSHHVTRLFQEQAATLCKEVDTLVDRSELDQTTLTMTEARQRVLRCQRDWGNTSAEEFWEVFGGLILPHLKCRLTIISNLETIETSRLESIVNEEIVEIDKIKQELELTAALDCLRKALRDGILDGSRDFTHALSAAREFNCPELLLVMIHLNDCENLALPSDIAQAMVESISPLFRNEENRFNSVCHFDWGRFLFHNKFIAEAELALKHAIKLDPSQNGPWIELGNLFRSNQQRYEEAEQAYRTAIALDPKDARPWFILGSLLQFNLNRYEEAEQAYRKGIDLDPKDVRPWINLGYLLQDNLNRYEEAEQAYRTAIELDPEDARPWNNLGGLLQDNLNRYEEAEQAYRTTLKLDAEDALSWISLGTLLQFNLNRYQEADQAYRTAIELDPADSWPWYLLGTLLQFNLNRYKEAEQAYRKAIEFDPEGALSWISLGSLLQGNLNRYEEAEQAYRKAIELDPKDARPWINLGNLLQNKLNRYEEAEQAYRKVIELDPKEARPWNGLGNLLQDHLARLEDAEIAYLQAIKLGTETVFPKANLAYLLLSQSGRVEEAEAAYAEAITLLPEPGRQLLTAYRALARDNFGEAIENLGKVLEQNHPELFTEHLDDLLRLLRLAKTRGYGERLMGFLRESGLAERHWPLSAAFDAYLYGEEQLRDVNPEVRGAAKRIFDWLNATPDAKPQTPSPAATRKRDHKKPRPA